MFQLTQKSISSVVAFDFQYIDIELYVFAYVMSIREQLLKIVLILGHVCRRNETHC